jgi:hypothetical protein
LGVRKSNSRRKNALNVTQSRGNITVNMWSLNFQD